MFSCENPFGKKFMSIFAVENIASELKTKKIKIKFNF